MQLWSKKLHITLTDPYIQLTQCPHLTIMIVSNKLTVFIHYRGITTPSIQKLFKCSEVWSMKLGWKFWAKSTVDLTIQQLDIFCQNIYLTKLSIFIVRVKYYLRIHLIINGLMPDLLNYCRTIQVIKSIFQKTSSHNVLGHITAFLRFCTCIYISILWWQNKKFFKPSKN